MAPVFNDELVHVRRHDREVLRHVHSRAGKQIENRSGGQDERMDAAAVLMIIEIGHVDLSAHAIGVGVVFCEDQRLRGVFRGAADELTRLAVRDDGILPAEAEDDAAPVMRDGSNSGSK
jgi:hypothetical protein